MCSLFGYMNDVPEGGGTRFTSLPGGPVTFQPQRGKAILWPSVLADDPHTKDERTDHEALPVTKGEKFGVRPAGIELGTTTLDARTAHKFRSPSFLRQANFWIHQYDFKGAHAKGCTAG